jgi:hypothetical protein
LEVESKNSENNFGGSVEMKADNFQWFSITMDEITDVRENVIHRCGVCYNKNALMPMKGTRLQHMKII